MTATPIQFAITLVICLAVVAIIVIAARAMGLAIPDWAVRVFWVVVVAMVAIVAIRIVAGI